LPVEDVPIFIARQKAIEVNKFLDEAYHQQHANKPILAADTNCCTGSQIIGKPVNRNDAIEILQALSVKTHMVITGVVIHQDTHEIAFSDITSVEFHPLSKEQIEFYVDKYELR
jgi:septum formation protein